MTNLLSGPFYFLFFIYLVLKAPLTFAVSTTHGAAGVPTYYLYFLREKIVTLLSDLLMTICDAERQIL